VIVSWSEHDLKVMESVLDSDEQQRLRIVYRNAIKTARPWHQKAHGKLPNGATLAYFCELLGFAVPDRYGTGIVGDALRLLRQQLSEGRHYADLTPKARGAWVAVVKHNRLDLLGTAHVLRKILS
jgi:hypothetical protein